MEKLTQSRSDNCWQTCVAMLVGCPVESLPAQHEYADRNEYGRVLRVYLDRHHGVTYVELTPEQFAAAPSELKKFHIMIGESPRTTTENPTWHAIVGSSGEPFWDVNESRAGLTRVGGYGLVVPTPPEWRKEWMKDPCRCPACAQRVNGLSQGVS